MDRRIVYVGELPRSADFLGSEKATLYAIGDALAALLGTPTAVHGLACAPTGPPSMQVTVGVGAIYAQETVDGSAYGPLSTDSNIITKQGLLLSPTTLTLTAPSTSGFSQVYLVQVAYNDVDSGAVVLPYRNSANPDQPLNGPSNSGTSQFTVRAGVCAVSLKAGTAATTGTQTAPAVDSGYVGLYLITVANGQTTITSGNISTYSGAPFIPLTLPQVPAAIQAQAGNYAVDTGSANAIAISLPYGTVLTAGMPLRIKKSGSANNGAVTVTVNGGSPFSATWSDGTPLVNGDWPANDIGVGIYDGTLLRLDGPLGPKIFGRAKTNILYFLNSGTWTVPVGVYAIKRGRGWGGGGGGGGSTGTLSSSFGGGGGGYAEATNIAVNPGDVITITIGAGGAGGAGAVDGGSGGTTTLATGAPLAATGGTGGSHDVGGSQGVGGTSSGGAITANGHDGTFPIIFGSVTAGGIGGGTAFGSGQQAIQITTVGGLNGRDGYWPGGGANGACTGSSGVSKTGGDGADGLVIIEWQG